MEQDAQTAIPSLSKRQRECLQGVADHLDSQQITQRLGISPHTVDGHIAAAVKALGARSRRDCVRLAGLLPTTGQSLTGQFPPVDFPASEAPILDQPNAVREVPTPFVVQPVWQEEPKHEPTSHPYLTLLTIFGGTVAAVILLLALDPLVRSAANLANIIQPLQQP